GYAPLEPRDELRALLEVAVHLGAEVAGPDAVRLDPEPRPVRAHRPSQLTQSTLRRRVRADRLAPQLARRRAGVHDLPAATLDHLRHHSAGDEERARQVRVEDAAPFVERDLVERGAELHARVVAEHVAAAE